MAEAVQVFVLPLATRKLALQKHWPYKAPILPVRCTPARRAFGVVAQAFSERFESQYPVRYDEYYNGDCLPNERDLAVRDLTWSELTRIKEFQQEDMYSFNCHMKELTQLVPDLGGRMRCMRVEVLQGIWRDDAIPVKLVELKLHFTQADVSRMVARRPSILIDKNFEAVPEASAYLQQFISFPELNQLAETQPWFLAAHLDEYLAGYSTVLDIGPREALRGVMADPGGVGYDYCYSTIP